MSGNSTCRVKTFKFSVKINTLKLQSFYLLTDLWINPTGYINKSSLSILLYQFTYFSIRQAKQLFHLLDLLLFYKFKLSRINSNRLNWSTNCKGISISICYHAPVCRNRDIINLSFIALLLEKLLIKYL